MAEVKVARAEPAEVGDDAPPPTPEPPIPVAPPSVIDVPDADGIYRDGEGKLYKKDRKGARYNVDMSGTRIFNFVDGRKTPRPLEVNSDLWDVMSRKQRGEYFERQKAKAEAFVLSAPGGTKPESSVREDARPVTLAIGSSIPKDARLFMDDASAHGRER